MRSGNGSGANSANAAIPLKRTFSKLAVLLLLSAATLACDQQQSLKVIVGLPSLSISKIPVVMAWDEGLFAKHGLNVEMWMVPYGAHKSRVYADPLTRLWRMTGIGTPKVPDITVDGATPMVVKLTLNGGEARKIAIGSTDCVVRAHIIARKGLTSLEELKGKRIGVSASFTTEGFKARLLAQRMGWDPVRDISIMSNVEGIEALQDGSVDAIVGYETEYADALKAGLPILADTSTWNEPIAGNSFHVSPEWLKDPVHREIARRFLKAIAEASAQYHREPEHTLQELEKWFGTSDQVFLKAVYSRGAWIPEKPYPCYQGYTKTMELFDSNEMRRYKPADFYDDSLMHEIDAEGFFSAANNSAQQSGARAAAR